MDFSTGEPATVSNVLEIMLKAFVIPAVLYTFHVHRDLVYKIIPNGMNALREELKQQGVSAKERHGEHLRRQDKIYKAIKEQGESIKKVHQVHKKKARPRGTPRKK